MFGSSTALAASLLAGLAVQTPLLAGAEEVTWVDVDDTIRATYDYAKQGAGFGYSGVKGLNALVAIVSTPLSRPVIAATRLRSGNANSARGASRLVADALKTARPAAPADHTATAWSCSAPTAPSTPAT